ncbi:MAG: hypothetical protein WC859_03480 [Elusimicrobiota bacterium]
MRVIQGVFLGILFLSAGSLSAQGYRGSPRISRDFTYEQALKYEAGVDKTLTPAKAFRWMMNLIGHPILSAPSSTEFQPIVGVQNTKVRIIAAFAYKF